MSILTDPNWTTGAVGILPWDIPGELGGPRRGSVEDYGGAQLEDEDPAPPRDGSMLYADMGNSLQLAAAAADKVHFALGISVTLDLSNNPALSKATGPAEAAVLGTVTLTANGAGDVSLTWPANTFPPSILGPIATLNDGTGGGGISAVPITNGVRVYTKNASDVAAYRAFTVLVW